MKTMYASGITLVGLLVAAPALADLDEIVVTAQKRTQNQEDVPITIQAMTSQQLTEAGILSITDLPTVTPGLQWTTTGTGQAPFIRGVGGANETPGQESPVSVYVDGVYYQFPLTNSFSFNNIERTEVLEGPQGTLFGRNATGGLIQIITKDPSHDPSATVNLSAGTYKTYSENFYGTTGVTDDIAVDLAVYNMSEDAGYGIDVLNGENTGLQNEIAARNKWLYSANNTKVTVIFDYSDVNSDAGLSRDLPSGSLGIGGTQYNGNWWNTQAVVPPNAANRSKGASINVDHTFDYFDLVSISAYRRDVSVLRFDAAVTSAIPLGAGTYYTGREATQEIHLSSNSTPNNTWITGLYFLSSADGAALDVYGPLYNLSGIDSNHFGGSIDTKSYSAFADDVVTIAEKSRLTLGARFTRDDRSVEGFDNLFLLPAGTPPVSTPAPYQSKSWQEPTWRVIYDYRLMENTLLYASYNRGFKSGNFDAVAPTNPAFNPEILDAYEVGAKNELLDHHLRLNVDAFFYNYKNLQEEILESFTEVTTNAAKAQIKGLEYQLTAPLTESFTLDSAASLVIGKYLQFPDDVRYLPTGVGGNLPAATFDASGRPIARTPKFTANLGGTYTLVQDSGRYTASVIALYNSGFPWESDGRLHQDAYTVVNLTLGWHVPSDRWGMRFVARNLGNARYAIDEESSATGDFYAPANPRTLALYLDVKF